MKTPIFEDSISCRSSFGRIDTERTTTGESWDKGTVLTPQGIVSVYAADGITRLDFCHDGRLHMRTYRKRLTKRGMTIVAGRMAKEIAPNP